MRVNSSIAPEGSTVLGGNEVASDVLASISPASKSVLSGYCPPNLGAETRLAVERADAGGLWTSLTESGQLLVISSGGVVSAPLDESGKACLRDESAKGQPLIMFRLNGAHGIHVLRNHTASPILVYEPDARQVKQLLDMRMSLAGVTIVSTREDFCSILQFFLQGNTSVSVFTAKVPQTQEEAATYEQFSSDIVRVIQAEQVTVNTIKKRMPEWVRHVMTNIHTAKGCVPAMRLVDCAKGLPCVIVAAGPSLNKNIHLLQEAKKKCLVLAVEVVCNALEKRGIEPHGVVTVEGRDMSKHMSTVKFLDHIPRLYSLQASPRTLAHGTSVLLPWADSNYTFIGMHNDVLKTEGLPIGGSVSTACQLIAEALGCDPIIFVGQDLANSTPEGAPYVDGVNLDGVWRLNDQEQVPAWGGQGTVTTAVQWNHARVWFEQRAQWHAKRGSCKRLIDASEGGSHIDGFEDIPLADVLAKLPVVEVPDLATEAARHSPILTGDVDSWLEQEKNRMQSVALYAMECCRATDEAADVAREFARDIATNRGRDMLQSGSMRLAKQGRLATRERAFTRGNILRAFIADRDEAEKEFRSVAKDSHVFTGWTQPLIKRLNAIRGEVVGYGGPNPSGNAARWLKQEAIVFLLMSIAAQEILQAIEDGWNGVGR